MVIELLESSALNSAKPLAPSLCAILPVALDRQAEIRAAPRALLGELAGRREAARSEVFPIVYVPLT